MQTIHSLLKSLGFLESEIKTYLVALERGTTSIIDLAKYTQLSRQATYVAVESLANKGLMSSVTRGKKKYYVVDDPEKIGQYISRKAHELSQFESDLKELLPELKLKKATQQTSVRVYDGKEGAMQVFMDMASTTDNEIIYEIADLDAIYAIFDETDVSLIRKKLLENKTISFHGLLTGAPKGRSARSIRHYLPKEYGNFGTDVLIYKNKISLVSVKGGIQSVIIENEALAQTLRILFKLATETAKKFPSD